MYIKCDSTGAEGFVYDDINLLSPEDFDRIVAEQEFIDEWGVVQCCDEASGLGVEYNFCIDWYQGEMYNECAFYTMHYNPDQNWWDTDPDDFVHYEIDFNDPDYRKKIKEFAISLLTEKIAEQ